MFAWFGRMLTFELVADDADVPLSDLLADASEGIIDSAAGRPIPGFAAHGSSIRDSVAGLIELMGVDLNQQDERLASPPTSAPTLVASNELGCDIGNDQLPRAERQRAAESAQPASLAMSYYELDRDYQNGQMRSSSGSGGTREERIELPAVLTAAQARQLVEQALARRWRGGDQVRLRLPPSRMNLQPGNAIQLAGSPRAWVVRSVSIEGMAVAVEAQAAPVTVPVLPADPGRAVAEPDVAVGRTELALFELPALGDAPDPTAKVYAAGANTGRWKAVPVELSIGSTPAGGLALSRRAVLGVAETVLDPRAPLVLDELSSVTVQLVNSVDYLLNADMDALMDGANLAVIGDELIQFARAELEAAGIYRLSGLLRGRRGTEWAAASHVAGEQFCLIDSAAMAPVDMAASAVGATVTATAHGIGDAAPLPIAARMVSGESLRPPSPCHLKLSRSGSNLTATWTRRSHRGWTWVDGVGVSDDPFPENYRVTASGPSGQIVIERDAASASFNLSELPGQAGDSITVSVSTIGPLARSRDVASSIII